MCRVFCKKFSAIPCILSLLLVNLCFLSNGFGLVVADYNEARVPVINQNSNLQPALVEALNQLLIKQSGNSAIATVPSIKKELANADAYVERYTFENTKDTAGRSQQWLHVWFDGQQTQALLRNAHQTIWSADRPPLLVWFFQSQPANAESDAQVVSAFDANVAGDADQNSTENLNSWDGNDAATAELTNLQNLARQQAARRGLPILFPLMDLGDQTTQAAWQQIAPDGAQLADIAHRYEVNNLLLGGISSDPLSGLKKIHWYMQTDQGLTEWEAEGRDEKTVIAAGMTQVADRLASRWAVLQSLQVRQNVQIVITGIQDLSDYAKVEQHLKERIVTDQLEIIAADGDRLIVQLSCLGGVSGIRQALQDDEMLIPDIESSQRSDPGVSMGLSDNAPEYPTNLSADGSLLAYQWQPGRAT